MVTTAAVYGPQAALHSIRHPTPDTRWAPIQTEKDGGSRLWVPCSPANCGAQAVAWTLPGTAGPPGEGRISHLLARPSVPSCCLCIGRFRLRVQRGHSSSAVPSALWLVTSVPALCLSLSFHFLAQKRDLLFNFVSFM